MNTKLGFYGGVGSVTGANFLLDSGASKIVVDCGLVQGDEFADQINQEDFAYDPTSVDFLLVTHAHADHIGRIPKLVKDGFRGEIYSTEPTRTLANVMLRDALNVMAFESRKKNIPMIYAEEDVLKALSLWKTVDYKEELKLKDNISAVFSDAGHILGSACITLSRGDKKITFSGDIGNVPQPLMNPPDTPKDYDYLVIESVYGDRKHEDIETRSEMLKFFLQKTIKQKGTLIIPAFSIERTQAMLFEINNLVEGGEVESLPVFLDSPLAIEVTEIYKARADYLKESVKEQIKNGDDIFSFPKLKFTATVSDSDAIRKTDGPKVIIAGSGMSHGGRIRKHEKNYLGDTKTIVLLVGYQAVGSVGRRLQDGAKNIKIDGKSVKVRAEIAAIRGWSGHADRDQLLEFVEKGGAKAKQVFVAMGEERSSLFLVQRIRDYLDINAVAPAENEVVELDF